MKTAEARFFRLSFISNFDEQKNGSFSIWKKQLLDEAAATAREQI